MKLRPYLTFNGNCQEAVDLYRKAFDVEAQIMRFGDMQQFPVELSSEQKGWILQAALDFGSVLLRMSDTLQKIDGAPTPFVSVGFEETADQVLKAFDVLQTEGTVKSPLSQTFFSSHYGEVIDKFGVEWKMAAMPEQN